MADVMADMKPANPGRFFAKVLADQHYQKGLQFEQQGPWEQALASYRKACALDVNNVLFLLARGHVCQLHGLEPEAEECYQVALRLRPADTVVLYNQAQLFAARGQLNEARTNLAKIVAGGTDVLGERAAPIFCRLGDIALRREDYTAASIHFRRALDCAPGHRYAAAALSGVERFSEFRTPFQVDGHVLPKVALYGYAGAMLLGLPSDDGIDIPAYPGLGFDSLPELAQTLVRLVACVQQFNWRLDAVAALDAESQPLAIALAAALDACPAATVEAVPRGASALGVTAAGARPGELGERAVALRERCARSLYYAVGLTHPVWEYTPGVQIVTAPIRLEFPWSRGEASAAEHAEAFGTELAGILRESVRTAAPNDGAQARAQAQAKWYELHPRLCFDRYTLALMPNDAGAAVPLPR